MTAEETEYAAAPAAVLCEGLGAPERLTALAESGLDARADPAMEEVAARVRRWMGVPVGLVSLVREDEQVFPGAAGLGEPFASSRRTPLTHSFCRHVVASAGPLVVEDARRDPTVAGNPAIPDLGVVAYAGMPLTDADGHVLGSLAAIAHEPRAWSTDDLDRLADLAAGCSAELRLRLARADAERHRAQRDRLELSLRDSVDRSQTLLSVSRSVGDSTSLEDVRAGLAELAGGVLAADQVALLTADADGLSLVLSPTEEEHAPERSAVGHEEWSPETLAVQERRVVSFSSRDELRPACCETAWSRMTSLGLHAIIAAPVLDRGDVLGVLVLGWTRPRTFSPSELLVVTTVAAYTARAIDHVGWVQHRVSVAREMQQAMLTTLPAVPGLELAARYEPADDREHVGGDWYDVSPLLDIGHEHDTVAALSVGDIIGHELGAAITMGQVRSMLRQAAWDNPVGPPSAIMRAFETANAGTGLHAAGTAVVAYVRRTADEHWSMTWLNAGHPPPILLTPDGTTRLLEGHGRLFGLPRGRVDERDDQEVTVPRGSVVVFYTDGVVERVGADVDERIEELRRTLTGSTGAGPEHVVDTVMTRFGRRAGDDVVVMAARFT